MQSNNRNFGQGIPQCRSILKINQYIGVNAHANGWLQDAHEWRGFHIRHIVDLTDAINDALPEGYIAVPETSLQIELTIPDDELPFDPQRPRPDNTIFDLMRHAELNTPSGLAAVGTLVPTVDTLSILDSELSAVMVYRTEDHPRFGRPVAWIELLSPTNKPPYSGALTSGIPLVEIDYLNQQRSVNAAISLYPVENGSQPYSITIHDPRPTLYDGTSDVILFGVDNSIPTIRIPLASGAVTGQIAIGAAYDVSYRQSVQLHRQVDYAQPPIDLAKYSERDQGRIRQRLAVVQAKHAQGVPLTDGPFAIETTDTPES